MVFNSVAYFGHILLYWQSIRNDQPLMFTAGIAASRFTLTLNNLKGSLSCRSRISVTLQSVDFKASRCDRRYPWCLTVAFILKFWMVFIPEEYTRNTQGLITHVHSHFTAWWRSRCRCCRPYQWSVLIRTGTTFQTQRVTRGGSVPKKYLT